MLPPASSAVAATVPSLSAGVLLEDQKLNPSKVFVGGLAQFVTAAMLRQYFEARFGAVQDCAIVYDRLTGRSRGFGFVIFALAQSADACVATFRHQITDFVSCEVRRAVPREDGAKKSVAAPKIFVSGLTDEQREGELQKYFERVGAVESVSVKLHRATAKSRGFAFVIFKEPGCAERALGKHPELGPQVEAKIAEPKRKTLLSPSSALGLIEGPPLYPPPMQLPPRYALMPVRLPEQAAAPAPLWPMRMLLSGARRYSPY